MNIIASVASQNSNLNMSTILVYMLHAIEREKPQNLLLLLLSY